MTKKEIQRLTNLILYHKRKYYEGEPEISDGEYDNLEEKLRELDSNNPVLFIVGIPEGGSVSHDPPMLSCQKAKTTDEILKWAKNKPITMGYKTDGLSLKLVYQDRKLIQAATRGSGLEGDDVTLNVMKIESIPKMIPVDQRIEIRGELYMKISEFFRINQELPENAKFSNPRNLAAGTLKQKDATIMEERLLDFKAWELLNYDPKLSVHEQAQILKSWKFDASDFYLINTPSINEISEAFKKVEKERVNLDSEIDGVVFKYNLVKDRIEAGATEHHPRWQIALKFESKGKTTTLKNITWQVGRTSSLTPVAELEPVEVSGAVISRATLHNADFLLSLNATSGDVVYVERSGEVIPKIISVTDKRSKQTVKLPQTCPSCDSNTRKIGVNLFCTGIECRDREIQQIGYWISTTGIEGIGGKSLEKLYDSNLVKNYSDLYILQEEQLVDLLGKNGRKIHESIDSARKLPFHVFLAALGIETLGKTMGKKLSKNFANIDELKSATIKQLTELEGISDITANYIRKGINETERYEQLFKNGLTIIYPATSRKTIQTKSRERKLTHFIEVTDQTTTEEVKHMPKIYITGKVEGFTKKQLQEFIEEKGFEWASGVTKNLDMLVVAENPGQKRLETATNLGVEKIPWEKFYEKYISDKE